MKHPLSNLLQVFRFKTHRFFGRPMATGNRLLMLLPWLLMVWVAIPSLQAQSKKGESLRLAQSQFEQKDYTAAAKTCTQIIFEDSKNAEAYALRGVIFTMHYEYEAALNDLEYAINLGTKNADAYFCRAEIRNYREAYIAANMDMEQAISMEPKNAKYLRVRSGILVEMGRLNEALSDAEKAIQLNPENPFGYRVKGYVLMNMEEYGLASTNFLRAQQIDSALTDNLLNYLGNCAYHMGKTEEAKGYFLKSIVVDTTSGSAWYYLGLMALANGNTDSCLAMMDSSIHHDIKFAPAYNLKGETLLKLGKLEMAILILDSSIYLGGPEKDIALKLRGDAKRQLMQLEASIMDYSKALLLDANYIGALVGRGKAYEKTGQYDRANRDFAKVQSLQPDHLEAEYMLAVLKWDRNENEAATAAFEAYLEKEPEDSRAWYCIGMLADGREDFESAIEHLTMALATHNSDSGEIYLRRSSCYSQLKKSSEANADMDRCLGFPTKSAHFLSGIGFELNVLHRSKEALKLLDSAIAIDSTHAFAFNNRGFAKYQLGQHESAIKDFDQSIALKNSYAHLVTYNRANAKRALGRYQEAIADFDLALGHRPEYFEAFNDRGETWEKLNETDKARADYHAALKINPEYLPSRLNLERIGK